MAAIRRIKLLGFVEEVSHIHVNMPDRRFCFLLGAGASKPSGIPSAGELGLDWLKKIHLEREGQPREFVNWLGAGQHGIADLKANTAVTDISSIAAAYPAIYRAKWGHDRAQGEAEIERHIERAVPSYGYYALAEILASDDPANPSRHNVVITPNFDNLAAETLGALGKKVPIVIGHSAIADFARPTLRRPLIIKFHHDFLLAPKSDPDETRKLDGGFGSALAQILRLYTPIVIGYGGNDGSLMSLLQGLEEKCVPGGILWCWRTGDPPGPRIEAVVARQCGTLVEISGFDEVMTLLEAPFGHVFDPERLRQRADARAVELQVARNRLREKRKAEISPPTRTFPGDRAVSRPISPESSEESVAVLDALSGETGVDSKTASKGPNAWWHWQSRINATSDHIKKERLFVEGLQATGSPASLLNNFALFLDECLDFDRAEPYYIKAIEAAPNHGLILANYAIFVANRRRDYDEAEELFLGAIAAAPGSAFLLSSYAWFLKRHRNDYDKADEYYQKAIAAEPDNADSIGWYAIFLMDQRGDLDKADEYFQMAIANDPTDVKVLANYCELLIRRSSLESARQYLRQTAQKLADAQSVDIPVTASTLWMAGLCRADAGRPVNAIIRALKLIVAASYGSIWNFDGLIAWTQSHSKGSDFWIALARVCGGKERPETLEVFKPWRDALPQPPNAALKAIAEDQD